MMEDPIRRFQSWFRRAARGGIALPEAMGLATADAEGRPSVRFVLLKQLDDRGFVFFTDARSRKGADLRANPRAAAVFYWHPIGKQIRIEGIVERVSAAEADLYWETRPRQSRLAATTSTQSAPIADYAELLVRCRAVARRLRGKNIPRPPSWTGLRIVPDTIEFWSRRAHRLHQRELFTRTGRGWKHRWLQP
jgi:pyridoxamine 5'-phosphate oxidase